MKKDEIKLIIDAGFTTKDGTHFSFVCINENEDKPEFKIINSENMTSDQQIEFLDWATEKGLTPRYDKIQLS